VMLFVGRKAGSATAATLARVVRSTAPEHDLDRTRVDLETPAPPPPITYLPGKFATATASIAQAVLKADTVDSAIINQSWSERDLGAFLGVQGWSVQNLLAYTDFVYA